MGQALPQEVDLDVRRCLTPVRLKPGCKGPLVKWGNGGTTPREVKTWTSEPGGTWGVQRGPELAVPNFGTVVACNRFLQEHPQSTSWLRTKTGRRHHVWVKPNGPVRSHRHDGMGMGCFGFYVVAPRFPPSERRFLCPLGCPQTVLSQIYVPLCAILSYHRRISGLNARLHQPDDDSNVITFAFSASACGRIRWGVTT